MVTQDFTVATVKNNTSEQGQLKSIAIFVAVATPMAMLYQVGVGSYIDLKTASKIFKGW